MNFGEPAEQPPSVLVLDDDSNFRSLLASIIKTTGVRVFEARNARDADVVLGEQRPSLAIVDFRLPGMDGMEWITKIRDEGNNIPLVFLTGSWCDAKTFNRLRSLLRVSLILQKPIVPDLFLEQIEFLLPRPKVVRENVYDYDDEPKQALEPQYELNMQSGDSNPQLKAPRASSEYLLEDSYATLSAEQEQNRRQEEAQQIEEQSDEQTEISEDELEPTRYSTDSYDQNSEPDSQTVNSQIQESFAPPSNLSSPDVPPNPRVSLTRMPSMRQNDSPYGKDAMRLSNSGLPSFNKLSDPLKDSRENRESQELKDADSKNAAIPREFEKITLSKDNQAELSIIQAQDAHGGEQLVASRQKLDVERALKVARAAYAKSLPEKVEELAQAVADLKADTGNSAKLDEVAQLAHRFKGTAGSLGFPEVGKAAANIEQYLLAGTTGSAWLDDKCWHRIESAVKLCTEIAESSAILSQAASAGKADGVLRRVLLVGPYESFTGLSRELAQKEIGESQLVDDFENAVTACTKQRFDCALFDMSNVSFAIAMQEFEKARQNSFFKFLPFAFITEEEWADGQLLYLGAEFNLTHHPDPSTIRAAVESLLSLRDTTKARVLTVDDDVVLTGFISGTLLSQGLAVHALNEPNLVLEALDEFEPDLVLVDVVMPGVSGYDICRLMRSMERWQKLPIIFLTSKSSPEGRAAAFRAGGNDLIAKPILTEELLSRVRSRLEVSQALKERAGTNERSGLITRLAFQNSMKKFIDSAINNGSLVSVSLLAVEGFQEVALSSGFAAQDKLFQELTMIVQSRFRLGDVRAQWSEGCIGLALSGVDKQTVSEALSYLQNEFTERCEQLGDTGPKTRRIRFGVAELLVDGITPESLVECAYQRLMVG